MATTRDFSVSGDRSHDFSGTSGHEFVSQSVSRRGEMLANASCAIRTTASTMLATTADLHRSTGIAIRTPISRLLSSDCYSASIVTRHRSSREVRNQHRADQQLEYVL